MDQRAEFDPELWVDEYGDYLYRYAYSRLRDGNAAEEVVQEAFVAGVRYQHQFKGKGSERGWLLAILKRKIIDYVRARAKHASDGSFEDQSDPTMQLFDQNGRWKKGVLPDMSPDQGMQARELWQIVRDCLDSLPDSQSSVFVLSVMEEVDSEEICRQLDITPSNLWVRLHRARLGLAKCVGPSGSRRKYLTMPNDRKASELLSKSFHGSLDQVEQAQLDKSLAENEEAAKFAKLSRMIQESVADVVIATESGDASVAPSLTAAAKARLRNSVLKAKRETVAGTVQVDVLGAVSAGASATVAGDTRLSQSRFTMLRKIGEGGLGTVWLARDEDLKRTVAIKEMSQEKAESPRHMQRFQREATITGLLEHPNVVPLYMYGVNSETGKAFYAMRFLGKQTLADAIQEYHARRLAGHTESIDLHRLLTVFLDICQAIAYAHSRGVVHRDLKPENVALDSFGQVIVLDWGIAKVLSDGELAIQCSLNPKSIEESMLTKTMDGEVIGTPLYMAPEQASGDLDQVDERTDVYGLGSILFSILTGSAPHQESSTKLIDDGIGDLLQIIAEGDAPSPRDFNSSVARDLEAICIRAMARERYTRHASALELADDVERWMAGEQEKRQNYEAVRLEGHNLRGHLNSSVRDFATNVRFMSTLPPIQGLIDSAFDEGQEDAAIWRERLSTIFRGLLKSNSGFVSVTYSRVIDGQNQELVRVEKPTPESEALAIPKSRLTVAPLSEFGETVMQKKPDDVHVAISPCTLPGNGCVVPLRLEAGVPVFDPAEEPFGMVVIEGDFDRLIESQMQHRNRASATVLVVAADEKVLVEDAEKLQGSVGQKAGEVLPSWKEIRQELDLNNDYVDIGREVFATRVYLVPRVAALTLVLIADALS